MVTWQVDRYKGDVTVREGREAKRTNISIIGDYTTSPPFGLKLYNNLGGVE